MTDNPMADCIQPSNSPQAGTVIHAKVFIPVLLVGVGIWGIWSIYHWEGDGQHMDDECVIKKAEQRHTEEYGWRLKLHTMLSGLQERIVIKDTFSST
jgi:hypothetical protein